MGEPAFLSEEFLQNQDPDVELVTTSGYGKNGALCVLQRSIRPQVIDVITYVLYRVSHTIYIINFNTLIVVKLNLYHTSF